MTKFKCRCKEIAFHRDVFEIAKYLAWDSDIGRSKAQEIMDSIHKGKYGSKSGIWVQYKDFLERESKDADSPTKSDSGEVAQR